MTYPELYIKWDKKRDMDYYKNEFVIYHSFDIAAYAARYGNFKNENSKRACTQLIVDTYEICKEVFGANRKYFRENMQLNSEGYTVQFEKYVSNKKEFNTTKNSNILFDYEREL